MTNNTTTQQYEVTKTFTSGLLAGITITEKTSVKFEVGREYKGFGSSYIVKEVR